MFFSYLSTSIPSAMGSCDGKVLGTDQIINETDTLTSQRQNFPAKQMKIVANVSHEINFYGRGAQN